MNAALACPDSVLTTTKECKRAGREITVSPGLNFLEFTTNNWLVGATPWLGGDIEIGSEGRNVLNFTSVYFILLFFLTNESRWCTI